MTLETMLFGSLILLYLPVQLAFLVSGIWLIVKSKKVWWKILLGIALLMLFTLMLPFTRVIAVLAYLTITGQGFGA